MSLALLHNSFFYLETWNLNVVHKRKGLFFFEVRGRGNDNSSTVLSPVTLEDVFQYPTTISLFFPPSTLTVILLHRNQFKMMSNFNVLKALEQGSETCARPFWNDVMVRDDIDGPTRSCWVANDAPSRGPTSPKSLSCSAALTFSYKVLHSLNISIRGNLHSGRSKQLILFSNPFTSKSPHP